MKRGLRVGDVFAVTRLLGFELVFQELIEKAAPVTDGAANLQWL